MPIAQSASAAFEQHNPFVMRFDLAYELPCLTVIHHGTAGHFDDFVLSVFSERPTLSAFAAIGSHDVFLIFEMQQRPEIPVSMQNHGTALAAVTAIRTTFRQVFRAMEMHATGSALSRAAVYLYVINEIGHGYWLVAGGC
jgi:hypothetical protein